MIKKKLTGYLALAGFLIIIGTGAAAEDFCQTQEIFETDYFNMFGFSPADCLMGTCDATEVRDLWVPGPGSPDITLRLYFNVFAEDDGSNPAATPSDIANQVAQINADLASYHVQFVYNMRTINSTQYRYLSESEINPMKLTYAVGPDTQCNVYVASMGYSFGTFPWDPVRLPLSYQGGIVLAEGHCYPNSIHVLTHEMGHNIGLWHTHHGVSEVGQCSDCWERADDLHADSTGDLCSDTPPTPVNWSCSDPGGTDPCSGVPWGSTSPENYMSYGGDPCWSVLTTQQTGRVHCWMDDVLSSWMVETGCTSYVAWTSTWGDTLAEHAYSGDRTDDGYVFCGRVGPYDAASLGSDILLVKTDSCGSAMWARTYGSDSTDLAYSVDVTSPDNGMIICGSTRAVGIGGTDIYVIKTNSSGDVEWTRTLGSTANDLGMDAKQTSDGGYIVIGKFGSMDFLIQKLNASGNTVWADTCSDFYGFEHYTPGEVIENSSGDFVVAGSGYDDDYDEYFIILFTWSSSGSQTGWHRYYMDHAHGYGLDQTSDGGYIVCGYLADTSGYTSQDILLLKVNSTFNQQWARTYDVDRGDVAYSVKQVDDGGYIATGEVSHGFYHDFNMYVLRTDNNGDAVWSKEIGGAYHDEGRCVNITPDNGFILTGIGYSFGDSENGDFLMVKLEAEPAAPVLVSPANGQYWYSTGMSVALDWQDAARADYYHVMVDNNSDFSSPIVDVDSLAASDYVTPVLGVSTYYWKVRGENETGYGPWSAVRSFQIRQPTSGGCPVLFSYDGLGFRRENPLLTACEASGYSEIVTDYYHLTEPVADDDGRVVFRIQEAADEVSYIHGLELITVDHAPDVQIACGVNGDIMAYRETVAPVAAVDHNGDDRLAEVVAEDGFLFTANESGHLVVTFPNSFGDLLSFSFTAMKKPDIIIDPGGGGEPKVLPGPVASSLRLEVLDDYGQWHEISSGSPSRDNPVSEFVFSELAGLLTGEFITLRLSWEGGYTTDALCQYLPAGEIPMIAARGVDRFERMFARPLTDEWNGFSGGEPLILRQGDIFEFSFDVDEAEPGYERDYIIRAVGRYQPAGFASADGLPGEFALHDNYPNPFNPFTTVKYDLPVATTVRIDVLNILGQIITTLVDGPQSAGSHAITWDGRDRHGNPVASGIYLYRFTSDAYNATKKMLLIK